VRLLKSALLVRHVMRHPAAILMAVALGLASCSAPGTGDRAETSPQDDPPPAQRNYATTAQVLDAVKAARDIQALPAAAAAQLTQSNVAEAQNSFDCKPKPAVPSTHFGECAFGDPQGKKLMVMYGDSHADTWAAALEGVAVKHGWKLRVFNQGGCPAPDLHYIAYATHAPNSDCDKFHDGATQAIRDLHPDVLLVTSIGGLLLDGSWPSSTQWRDAWISTFQKLSQPGTRLVLLANVPSWTNNDARCLAAHTNDVQNCSAAVADATVGGGKAGPAGAGTGPYTQGDEQSAAAAAGAQYISPQPWICTDQCEPVVADNVVYRDVSHLTQVYAEYLTGALGEALQPVLNPA
jgi:SGNH domain (fused to AT3 domains)